MVRCLQPAPPRGGALCGALALIVAAAVAPPASAGAAARQGLSYDIYGTANLSLDFVDDDDTAPGRVQHTVSLSSNQSYLGVFAAQPLGGRWIAVARLEGGVEGDTGHIFTPVLRDTYVGAGGPLGIFKAGHFASAYKTSTEWMDPFRNTLGDAQAVLGNVDGTVLFSQWYSNVIGWETPEFRHWQVDADYIINQGNDQLPQTAQAGKRSAFSIDLHGHNDYMKGGVAYEQRNATSYTGGLGAHDISAVKVYVGAWVPRGKRRTFVTGVYEHATGINLTGTGTAGRNAFYFSAVYHWRTLAFKGAMGWLTPLNGVRQSGALWYALGATHYLTPRIENYVVVTMMNNGHNGTYGLGQFQGDSAVTGSGNVAGLPGKNVVAVSLGLSVSFGGHHPP